MTKLHFLKPTNQHRVPYQVTEEERFRVEKPQILCRETLALKIDIFGFRGLFEKWMRVGINIGKELIIQIIKKKTVKIKALKADQVLLISFSYVLVLLCFWGFCLLVQVFLEVEEKMN